MIEDWTFTEETYSKGKNGEEYTVYYAAPKPYKYGFITSLSKEGREIQYQMMLDATREKENKDKIELFFTVLHAGIPHGN